MTTDKKYLTKKELIKQAVTLHLRGYTDAQIGRKLERDKSTVCKWKQDPFWKEEVEAQGLEITYIREDILEGNAEAIEEYKTRLKEALDEIEAISKKQLLTASIGQDSCLKFVEELKDRYKKEGVEFVESQTKTIRVISELQRSINDAMRTATENLRFTTQLDTVYNYFKAKEESVEQTNTES